VLKSYLPALVFLALGIGIGTAFTMANSALGPRRAVKAKRELFDIEVVFLYPVAIQLDAFGTFALVETAIFIVLLLVALGFVWRRGALEWR
jgi:NADH-quinone oxidoreductase subunit A